jgi:hypothetical protein
VGSGGAVRERWGVCRRLGGAAVFCTAPPSRDQSVCQSLLPNPEVGGSCMDKDELRREGPYKSAAAAVVEGSHRRDMLALRCRNEEGPVWADYPKAGV